ncbi:NUDIX hydrolase domain-like protein [Trichoderma pleuroticola]
MPQISPPQESPASPPKFLFDINDGLDEWSVPAQQWLDTHKVKLEERQIKLDKLATGCIVFNPEGKILLIQRASHDSLPNRWETPGGGVDTSDATILHGAARELWEETRLVAKRFVRLVTEGPEGRDLQVFPNSTKTLWLCRFSFDVEVERVSQVTLDAAEHQDFVWASEDEVRAQKIGDRDILVTHDSMRSVILESFRLRKEN